MLETLSTFQSRHEMYKNIRYKEALINPAWLRFIGNLSLNKIDLLRPINGWRFVPDLIAPKALRL